MKRRHPIARFFSHLISAAIPSNWQVQRHFSKAALRRIEQAIKTSELTHTGEIRFVVEAGLHPLEIITKKMPKKRAVELFSHLGIWDTENNNGVLIYLLLADRDVEIVADRGIHRHVSNDGWEVICHAMELQFRRGEFEAGVLDGIQQIGALLHQYYPADSENKNELPNAAIII
ncbi:TPM domain-containing protein [Methylotenera versatilis]|uniref:TPM domain-containing protein n=1 Tax=Methylotenera versatilis TaxID=1055487 RepID=UPI000646F5AC|nr:TPM domain-containing protein [Methylotenera versatilis]